MPRKPTARPVGEYLATASRMLRQVTASTTMPPVRARKIRKLLSELVREFTDELEGRPPGER